MRAAWACKRIGGSVGVAAALAAAAASPAAAMIAPACHTRVVAADTGATGSCSFDTQYDYATITVVPVAGTVKVNLRCVTPYGYVFSSSRTVSQYASWATWTPGACTLMLTSGAAGTTAIATATPTTGPIIDPPPPPAPY